MEEETEVKRKHGSTLTFYRATVRARLATTGEDGQGNVTALMEALKRSSALKRDAKDPDGPKRRKMESGGAKKGNGPEHKTRTARPETTTKKASRKGA